MCRGKFAVVTGKPVIMKPCFVPADILLPDFSHTDGERWAVVACDQFTSQPEYWEAVRRFVGDAPSTLDLILPEAYLSRQDELLPEISRHMTEYLCGVLHEHPQTYIYLERTQSDGRVRRGLVGAVDLECYDWHRGAVTPVRATEGTVPERIPPRVRIRESASIELPHIMLLIDDPEKSVIEPLADERGVLRPAYDFELMAGGGHVRGWFVDGSRADELTAAVSALSGEGGMTIAVGDGNHSLATAKTVYESLKARIGAEAAAAHPARYALAELVNIHDDALDFEPIYRTVTGIEPRALIAGLDAYLRSLEGGEAPQTIRYCYDDVRGEIVCEHPVSSLTVGTVQSFLDGLAAAHPECEVDYIHGEDNVAALAKGGCVGLLFDGMAKSGLFRAVELDGALPRKTFSMGHAEDKRYYIEARRILK